MLNIYNEIEITEPPLLVAFLNFHSYILATPFRIVQNAETNFTVSSSIFRKILCFILQLFISLVISIQVIPPYRWYKFFPTNVALLLYFLATLSFSIGPQVLSFVLWKNSRGIVEFCNMIRYPKQESYFKNSHVSYMICFGSFLFIVLHIANGMLSPGRTEGTYRTYSQLETWLSPVEIPWWIQIQPGYNLKKSGYQNLWRIMISVLHSYVQLSLTLFLIITLSFRQFVRAELLNKINNNAFPKQVLKAFKTIVKASEKLRSVFNLYIIGHFYMSLTLFAQLPLMYMNKKFEILDNITLILYLALTLGTLYMATQINHKILSTMQNYIEDWSENLKSNTQSFAELGALYHEQLEIVALMKYVKHNSFVGISCQFFTIDKDFFRSVLGASAGYAVIVIQLLTNSDF